MSFGQNIAKYMTTFSQANQEFSEKIPFLVENIQKHYQNEIVESQTYESHYFDYVDQIDKLTTLQQQLLERIEQENQKHEQFEKDTTETKMHIDNLKSSIEKLERLVIKKESESKELEESEAALKGKLQFMVEEKENLTKLRQEILTYKLLTRVDLVFSSKKVDGLIFKNVPKPFRFDPEKLPMEEITNKMWELILDK